MSLTKQQTGADDGKGIRPLADRGGLRGDKLTYLPMRVAWVGGSAV